MNKNTNTVAATTFVLSNPTSQDVRENLGVTPQRANEIIKLIHTGAKADGFGENIKGAAWSAVANLTNEGERLFGAWVIGHGIGMSDDQDAFADQEGGENPLAALLGGDGLGDSTPDLDDDDNNAGN